MTFLRLASVSIIFVSAATSPFAATIDRSFSASAVLQGTFAPGLATSKEIGTIQDNFTSPSFPSAFTGFQVVVNLDTNRPSPSDILNGTISQCAANGIDCITGTIDNFARPAPYGAFFRTTDRVTITSGTGIYAGATGGWNSDVYGPASGPVTPDEYNYFYFSNGNITTVDGKIHQFQHSGFGAGKSIPNPASPIFRNDEIGGEGRTGSPDRLPALLVNLETDITFDATGKATGGNSKWCSADGKNCLFGQLSNFRSGTSVGDFTNRTLSTTQVTGGTGVYDGATGSWEADAYSVPTFDQSQNLTGYSLVAFLDGHVTFTDTTTPPTTNNGGGGGGGCTLVSKAEFDPILLMLMFSALIYLGLRKSKRVIV